MNEELIKLARRTLWTAFVFNDHNFDPVSIVTLAREDAAKCGIHSFEEANAFLDRTEQAS